MQRDEKQLQVLLDAAINRITELKNSLMFMIQKVETEYETINWPTLLDNFALISSHLTGLTKILVNELCPPLRNLTVLPLLLSPDHDEALARITEGRITVFGHDLVPDYLRTKPEPAAEERILSYEQKAMSLSPEMALKMSAQFTKIISHVHDMVNKTREEWEVESSSRSSVQQTSSLADTHALVGAVGMGKGLKPNLVPGQIPGGGGILGPTGVSTGVPGMLGGPSQMPGIGGPGSSIVGTGPISGGGGGVSGVGGASIGSAAGIGMGGGISGVAGGIPSGLPGMTGVGGGGVVGVGGIVGGGGGVGVGTGPAGLMVPPAIRPQTSISSTINPSGIAPSQIGKAPSGIKTNIKSANQIHPYAR